MEIDYNGSTKCGECGREKVHVMVPEGDFWFHVCQNRAAQQSLQADSADIEMDNLKLEGYYSPGDKAFVEDLERYAKPKEEAL